jgi:putative hydrolase of the HAD superfamily
VNSKIFSGCKAILFDFGGTLDSDGEHWLDRFYGIYDQLGLKIPQPRIKVAFYRADERCCADDHVNSLGLRPLMELHVRLQFESLGIKDEEAARKMVEMFCKKSEGFLRRNARLFEGMRRRFRLGVISNFYGNVETICKEAGLTELLDLILDSVRIGVGKPEPGIFLVALDRLDLPPHEVIFVGDSYERDMIPSRNLGMKTIWLKGPCPRTPPNAGPVDAWISHLTELEEIVS